MNQYLPFYATLGTKFMNRAWDVCVVDLKDPVDITPASVGETLS